MKNKLLTIIVPCYNEENVLPLFIEAIKPIREQLNIDTEILFINDGSKDNTLQLLKDYNEIDKTIRYISFSRNFGKEAAILAGLKYIDSDYCVLLDADLQHPVEYIPIMYNELISGDYDSVAMYRDNRKKESFCRRHFSSMFFKILNKCSKLNIVNGATDFRMMNRLMINSIIELPESNRFSKGIFNWVGFNTKWLPFETADRLAGESKWSFKQLLHYSFDAILSFSEVPLKISSWLGAVFCLIAFGLGIIQFVKTVLYGDPVAGFPTLYIMLLLMSGLLLLFLGIIGQYLARIYVEVKRRPLYIIKETDDTNTKED